MKIIQTVAALRKSLLPYGGKVGLVPTMGALHEGHLSLVARSVAENEATVVSIFVNPTQFGAGEDFEKYPRALQADAALCKKMGATFVFAPSPEEMYAGNQTSVYNPVLEDLYCGHYRHGHFEGVLTVVCKLMNISGAARAYFGQKDYQQLFLIRQMVADLNLPVRVVGLPIVREESGLAKSSRNAYLAPGERDAASSIYQGLQSVKRLYKKHGERSVKTLARVLKETIEKAGGEVQYTAFASRDTLLPQPVLLTEPTVALVAAFFGKTRLIDNIEL
jgi:pantoate--beta-alanine ligase